MFKMFVDHPLCDDYLRHMYWVGHYARKAGIRKKDMDQIKSIAIDNRIKDGVVSSIRNGRISEAECNLFIEHMESAINISHKILDDIEALDNKSNP